MNDDYLACRDLRHAWLPYTVEAATLGSRRGYRQRLRCARCRTIRTRLIDDRGYVIGSPRYSYPDGYLAAGGPLTPDDRAALRLNALRHSARGLLRVVS